MTHFNITQGERLLPHTHINVPLKVLRNISEVERLIIKRYNVASTTEKNPSF